MKLKFWIFPSKTMIIGEENTFGVMYNVYILFINLL